MPASMSASPEPVRWVPAADGGVSGWRHLTPDVNGWAPKELDLIVRATTDPVHAHPFIVSPFRP